MTDIRAWCVQTCGYYWDCLTGTMWVPHGYVMWMRYQYRQAGIKNVYVRGIRL